MSSLLLFLAGWKIVERVFCTDLDIFGPYIQIILYNYLGIKKKLYIYIYIYI